jgi:hypothetical protein
MVTGHSADLRFSGTGEGARSPKIGIGDFCAFGRAGGELAALSRAVSRGACVTLLRSLGRVLTVLTQTPTLQGDIAAGRDLCGRDAFEPGAIRRPPRSEPPR